MLLNLPDIQDREPLISIPVGKVGVTGIKMPIGFAYFENKPTIVVPTFSVFVDLPANRKGIHASRNYESVTEVLRKFAGKTYKLEHICSIVAKALLSRHEHAKYSEVQAVGEVIIEKRAPKTRMLTFEPCTIIASAYAHKKTNTSVIIKRKIGVAVKGIAACPCAQEMLKENITREIGSRHKLSKELTKILKQIPWATHMQRSYGRLVTEVPEGYEVDVAILAHIVEKSMSSSSYELLKRSDEVELIKQALENPRFVEDCIRYMIKNYAESFKDFPDNIVASFKQKNYETIHKHNFVAERTTTLGEIRKELKIKK